MKKSFVTFLGAFCLLVTATLQAQHLTISSGGDVGPTSGTNWGIIDNVLYVGNSGSASIHTSVITNHLQNTGNLTINLPWQSTVGRNIYINNSIAYSGSVARSLTFQSANDIVFANAVGITSATASLNIVLRAATTTGSPDNGSVTMDGINLDTKGGHIWVGGGATTTTWNGLDVGNSVARTYSDNVSGISIVGSSITSGGGKIYMNALSWDSFDDDGVNYGMNVQNSNISSGAGDIYINADVYGRYTNGIGMYIHGTTAITSTTGTIYIRGYGIDQTSNGNSPRVAASIQGSAQIKSVSGNITVVGDAAFTATINDKEGLNITAGAAICSQTGNITLRGTNTLETSGQYSNSIRFTPADAANSIRIGYDGTNAYSGNITIEGNSIYQRDMNGGAGSIAVQTTGTLTIQPTGTAFTYMRAGNSGTLTFDNDWNFGTNLGGFVYGKTTNTTALTYSNALTTNGPITIYAGALVQNGAFSTTSASGHIALLSKTHITNTNATTITTQGGNVLFASNVDDATDGESTTNGYIQLRFGITVNSNGGNITFGGGNTSGSDYSFGSSAEDYTEGVRFDTAIALNSGGGNISIRGKSYNRGVQWAYGASGVGFYYFSAATGTINSGTGTITIDGYSQTHTSTYAAGFYCMNSLTVSSANTTANAISISGKATGASGEAWGIESEGTLSILATGTGGGITINTSKQLTDNYDAVFRGETNILAVSGPINIKTGQLSGTTNGYMYLGGHMYLGSKASSAVTSSSSNINIQVDRYHYDNGALPQLATSGSVTIQPNGTSFGMDIYTSYFNLNQNGRTMTAFTFGKSGNAGNLYLNSAFTVAGPISVYGNYVQFTGNITSSATGDIFIKSLGNGNNPSVYIGAVTINKSAGTGTLTFQASGRVLNYGTLSATGTGLLNVVLWSDYDNTNQRGGVSQMGTISTNGGHVWMGGSNSASGSYTWNGLTVGDGPSIGSTNYNCNAIDLFGPITTGGGDVLLWASNNGGCGISGIQTDGTRLINAGSGDITLIAYQTGGAIELTSTGVISLVPHAGGYTSALTLGGTLTSSNFTFNTSFYNGLKINSLANSGLVIGNYSGHLSSGNAVTQGNTATVTASTVLSTKSLEIYGGSVVASAALTAAGNIILDSDNGSFLTQNTKGVEINAAVTTTNNGNITINGRGGSGNAQSGNFGVQIAQTVEAGGSGAITVTGIGGLSSNGVSGSCHGVNLDGSSAWIKSNGGNVTITGNGGGANSGSYSQGVTMLNNSRISAGGSGILTITGTGGVNTIAGLRGVLMTTGSSVFTGGGAININGYNGTNGTDNSDGFIMDNATVGSSTSGPITIVGTAGGGTGSDAISMSSTNTIGGGSHASNITLRGNNMALAGTNSVTTSGQVTVEPFSDSFSSALNFPIDNLAIANTITGLTLGKSTNTANITFNSNTNIAGPITAYGGTITLNANLSTTNNGAISLYTDNPMGGLSTPRTLTAAGAFKYIPRTTTFTDHVTYPIANLAATSTGLTIGNATNDKNITINADVTGGAGIELYGNNVNINSNLKTTNSAEMYLKGNTTIAAEKYIESNGDFTHDGNMTFKSDSTGTAAFGTLGGTFTTVSGLATTERYIPAKRAWRLLNAPLKGATNTTVPANWQGVNGEGLLLFSPASYQSQTMTGYTLGGGMPNIWKYNNGWQAIPNLINENLFTSTGANGFLVFATGPSDSNNAASGEAATTLKPQGQLITGAVSNSIVGNQYNLVANPYASALNTEAMVLANSGSKVWMVDPSLGTVGGYFTYDGANWAPETPSATDKNIQSGQAFFVRTASNSTFSITESHKISGSSTTWFSRTANSPADKIRVLLYKEKNSEWQLADGILAVNSASGNDEVDNTDTGKMSNFNENLLFRNGTSNLAIEYRGLPTASTTQSMRLTGTTVQPYQLKVKAESYSNTNLQPYIQDTQLGTVTAIPTDGSEITIPFTGVSASSTNPDNRFRIIYQSTLSTNGKDILSVGVYPNPVNTGVFTVLLKENTTTASYTLTNLLGQQVQVGKLMQLSNSVYVTSLQIGIYILQVEQAGKTFSTKLIIK